MGSLERIDETDARILELLQRDGRESYAEVGQAVGMSGPSAHERVKKLEARGVIRGYSAQVDPTQLGYGVLAFIFIKQVPARSRRTSRRLRRSRRDRGVPPHRRRVGLSAQGSGDGHSPPGAGPARDPGRAPRLHDADPGRLLERVRAPAAPPGPRGRSPAGCRVRQLGLVSDSKHPSGIRSSLPTPPRRITAEWAIRCPSRAWSRCSIPSRPCTTA